MIRDVGDAERWLIEWTDARSEDGWAELKDLDMRCAAITTVGYLIEETTDLICLAASKDDRTGQVAGIMYIPKVCIRNRSSLCRNSNL